MSTYPPQQTVKEAMQTYFRTHNLGEDGGVNKMWAKIKVGPVYIPLLNIPARRKVLVLHDIHHIVTGYSGEWVGEVSISAWELSTGCSKYWVAWLLDLSALAIGLFIYPKAVFEAFIRGRRTKNLYKNNIPREEALSMKIIDLQNKLLLDSEHNSPPTSPEKWAFVGYSLMALALIIIPTLIVTAALLYWYFRMHPQQ